jgi:aryl-alcohol dehydrogenase-like predicted oxidoreductase
MEYSRKQTHFMQNLGKTKLQVSQICLGGNVFGWTADEATSFRVLDAYREAGGNFIDTADVYSAWGPGHHGGESETVLGKWMHERHNRAQVILATKVGMLNTLGRRSVLAREHILRAVEASLQRLQTDYIDIYFAHADDAQTPLEETLATFAELVQQGKVRVLGASNYSAERMQEALKISQDHDYPRYELQQPFYNLVGRERYEGALAQFCVEQQVSVVPYSSLASGFLTGKYQRDSDLPQTPRADGVKKRYWNDRNFALLEKLEKVAVQYNATPTQVALAWLLTRPGVTAPIASATSPAQVTELLGSLQLQLAPDALNTLEEA